MCSKHNSSNNNDDNNNNNNNDDDNDDNNNNNNNINNNNNNSNNQSSNQSINQPIVHANAGSVDGSFGSNSPFGFGERGRGRRPLSALGARRRTRQSPIPTPCVL